MLDEKQLQEFTGNLKDLPVNMRGFSLSLRSLYSEKALGSSSPEAVKVKKLRDETRRDAQLYVKGVLPLATEVVRSIQSCFEYYSELTFEEWMENLADILDEVYGYKQSCTVIVSLHDDITTRLKKRQDQAKVLMSELTLLTKEYERRRKQFEKTAGKKRSWGVALSFIPGVNLIAAPILGMSRDADLAKATALTEESEIAEAIIIVMRDSLMPAISAFIKGLEAAAGFFSVIENEITIFQTRGETATKDPKKLHHTMMKSKAREIASRCREFYAMLPGVRTDLACIPEKPDDQNYVDKWLVKQKKNIEEEYSSGITKGLQKVIQLMQIKDAE